MPPESPDEQHSFPRPGFSAWRVLVWAALTLFLFNFWAVGLHHRLAVLDYEIPGAATLAAGHWWTLLTYVLTGAGMGEPAQWLTVPLSLLFLILAAQLAEGELPRRDFIVLCVACAIGGVAVWLPLHWSDPEPLRAGCSVLVLGLGAFLCFALPDEPLQPRLLFALNVRPQAFFWLVLALEIGAFLAFELPQVLGHPGVFQGAFDHSAQIGAMLTGCACARFLLRADAQAEFPFIPESRPSRRPAVPVAAARIVDQDATAKSAPASRREMREAIDRILDKINHDGFESLSPQEHEILTRAKDLLRK